MRNRIAAYCLLPILCLLLFVGALSPVLGVPLTEIEPNNELSEAQPITFPATITGVLSGSPRQDSFVFQAPVGGIEALEVNLILEEGADTNVYLSLFDSSGRELTKSDFFSEGLNESLVCLKLPAGTFTVQVGGGVEPQVATYILTVGEVPVVSDEQVGKALHKALDYLIAQQAKDGSWGESFQTGMTGLALQALLTFEGPQRDDWKQIYKGLDYLKTQFKDPAKIEDPAVRLARGGAWFTSENESLYEHAIGLTTAVEALEMVQDEELEKMGKMALDFLLLCQLSKDRPAALNGPIPTDSPAYGGWKYASNATFADLSVTGWHIIAMAAARKAGFNVPEERWKAALDFVKRCYVNSERMFAYEAGTGDTTVGRCAMGALSLFLLGAEKDPAIAAVTPHFMEKAPAWEGEPGGQWPFYYWYYGTRTTFLIGGDTWKAWKRNIQSILVRHQKPDGSWEVNMQEKVEANPVYVTALGAMMLEITQGHLPAYLRKTKGSKRIAPAPPVKMNDIKVKILNPRSETVTGNQKVTVEVTAPEDSPLAKLTITIDGQELFSGAEGPFETMFFFGETVAEHIIVAKGENTLGKVASDQVQFRGLAPLEIDFTCTVTDENNQYQVDLKKEQFQILEEGQEQAVVRFSKDVSPVVMALVLDTSGSMKKSMAEAQKAACQFVSQIQPEDRVSILEFSDDVRQVLEFTSDKDALKKCVNSSRAKGGTALYDALYQACERLKSQKGRGAIIVMSDGKDEDNKGTKAGSKHTFDEVKEKAREAGVTIYTLGLGKNLAKEVLETLAHESGGRSYFTVKADELAQIYDLINKDLRSVYTLGYSSTNRQLDGSWRNIEVRVGDQPFVIRCRKGFFAR